VGSVPVSIVDTVQMVAVLNRVVAASVPVHVDVLLAGTYAREKQSS
jgi:hypothetical protein